MRINRTVIPALCGATLFMGAVLPVYAQAPTNVGPATTTAAPVAPTTPASDQPLAIPMPLGMTVQTEIDLHDDDLLGVFKSLLRGIGQAATALPTAPQATVSSTQKGPTDAQIAAILSNADLSDVFKDVTHIHFVLLTSAAPAPAATKKMTAAKAMAAPAPTVPDQTAFYETAFNSEGGRRIIYSNFDPVHVIMTSFGHARGFAFMVQAPGTIAVLRADGYPDLSKLSALATSIGAAAGKAALTDVKVAPGKTIK